MKQGANSAVRFTSYATMQQALVDYTQPASGKLGSTATFGLGAIAGLITVCALGVALGGFWTWLMEDTTMPLDNVKTRMQSIGAESKYRNSFDCLTKVGWGWVFALTLDRPDRRLAEALGRHDASFGETDGGFSCASSANDR